MISIRFIKEKKNAIIALLYAIFSTIALVIDIRILTVEDIESKGIFHRYTFLWGLSPSTDRVSRLIGDFYLSVQYDQLVVFIIFVSLLIYFLIKRTYKNKKILLILAAAISMMFMLAYYEYTSVIMTLLHSGRSLFKFSLCFVGYAALLYQLLNDIFYIFTEVLPSNSETSGKQRGKDKYKFILQLMLVFLVCWSPYIIAHYPGILIDDCAIQFREMSGLPIQYNEFFLRGQELKYYYTDGNAIMTTFLLKAFFDFGNLAGNQNLGIFLYILMQTVFLAFAMAYSVWFWRERKINSILLRAYVVFIAVFHVFPVFSTYVLPKNTLLAAVFIFYSLVVFRILFEQEAVMEKGFCLKAAAVYMGLIFLNKFGVYIILISSVVIMIYMIATKSRYWKRIILSIAVPFIISNSAVSVINRKIEIIHIKPVEMYSVFFQQTGRYVKEYGDEVTEEEKEVLNRIFEYDRIADSYAFKTSDPMKDMLYRHLTVTDQDMSDYRKVWLGQFLKHPLCYFAAVFDLQANLLNVSYTTPINYGYDFSCDVIYREFDHSDKAYYGRSYIEATDKINISMPESTRTFAYIMENFEKALMKLPFINILSNMGIYFYIYFSLLFFCLLNGKTRRYVVFLVPVMVYYLIMVASPYSSFRYLVPLIIGWPTYVFAYISINKKNDSSPETVLEN